MRAARINSPLANLSARALYETCADQLAREIAQGTISPGHRLPSERSLAQALGYTRLTVRRALKLLAQRGMLEPDDRRGWCARRAPGPMTEPLNTLMGFTQMARLRGLVASSRVLAVTERDATLDEAESLRVAAGSPLMDLSRLRLLDDRPTAIEQVRMPVRRIRWPAGFDFTGSVYEALESQGVIPTRADAFVEVADAIQSDSELLGVAVGRGLLRMSCVTFAADGLPISLETSRYHPDRFRFRATLERRPAA